MLWILFDRFSFLKFTFRLSRRKSESFRPGSLAQTWNIVIRQVKGTNIHHNSAENHSLIDLILRLNQAEMSAINNAQL